ncbi:glycine--tRNA ligase [Sulfodiicoccus acidiphilus]|uniref:glycine--tRNA ligase n=1 Tax=Sulfodiicoccus acidiphilus TaxID=1670455 RepID=UPI001E5BEE7C|nr:glycine--tRNA ligase [Sulfodiicoccus acidiphilus]
MDNVDKVLDLAKRRGLFWPSYEIYGGVGGLYDLGHVGVKVKNRIIRLWRRLFVEENSDFVVEIETPVITPKRVLEASGHVQNFTDPVVECLSCHRVFRADHLVEGALHISAEGLTTSQLTELIKSKGLKCPQCGGELGEARTFNLLFTTNIGPYTGETGYLRPETAQGIFTSFKRVFMSAREKLPLGIAQVGRVARNEISPRQGLLRMREFTIMEMEFFIDPKKPGDPPISKIGKRKLNILLAESKVRGDPPSSFSVEELMTGKLVQSPWMVYWMAIANDFVNKLGIRSENSYFEEKLPQERAHYSSQTFDQLVVIGDEKIELSGHAYRTDYDLSRHMQFSGEDLTVFRRFEEPKLTRVKKVVQLPVRKDKLTAANLTEFLKGKSPEEIEEALKLGVVIGDTPLSTLVKVEEVEEKVSGEKFVPHVIEPSFGVERCLYVATLRAYREIQGRVVLSLPIDIVPYDVAVFPLLGRDDMVREAERIVSMLRAKYDVLYDSSGSIGRRYARIDEIGVPFAITVDGDTLRDGTVTIRDRDSWNQVRVPQATLLEVLEKLFNGEKLESLGMPVKGEL